MSGSKYETMAKAVEKKLEELNKGASDLVRQKQLENRLKRLDKVLERKIKEIKASPVDSSQIVKEAELEYNTLVSQIKRGTEQAINKARQDLKQLDVQYEFEKKKLSEILDNTLEDSKFYEEKELEKVRLIKERKLSSVNNTENLLSIKIDKLKEEADKEREEIEIELDNVIAINDSKAKKMEALDTLYADIKEISLAIGDVKK
jgi:hypothetical protein